MPLEITTVADDLIVTHEGAHVERLTGLTPQTEYTVAGRSVQTLARPDGELLCRVGTVNDVHFGEVEAGRVDEHPGGPVRRVPPDADPYPEVMNRAAVAEMLDADLTAVIAKGDLTTDGTEEEFATYEAIYGDAFGARLHTVRGNHDAYRGQDRYGGDQWIELPGIAVALLDTAVPFRPNGTLRPEQLEWLDERAGASPVPVLAMGHHHQWIGTPNHEHGSTPAAQHSAYFGIDPQASEALAALIARRPSIIAYTCGHSHRHRVRTTAGGVPSIEVGCVKDFPGTWAEYRVYETGVMQVVHRISAPEALVWSEQCRDLYSDFGIDYTAYALGTLADRCLVIPLR